MSVHPHGPSGPALSSWPRSWPSRGCYLAAIPRASARAAAHPAGSSRHRGQAHHRAGARRLGRLGQLERGHGSAAAPATPSTPHPTRCGAWPTTPPPGRLPGHHPRTGRPGRALLRRHGHHQRRHRQPTSRPWSTTTPTSRRQATPAGLTSAEPGSCLAVSPGHMFNVVPYPRTPPPARRPYVKPSVFPGCFANSLPAAKARCWPRPSGRSPPARDRPVGYPGLEDHPVLGRRRHRRPRHPAGRAALMARTPARTSPRSTPRTCR